MIYKTKSYIKYYIYVSICAFVCLLCCMFAFSNLPNNKNVESWQNYASTNFKVKEEQNEKGATVLVNYISTPEQLAGAMKMAKSGGVYADDVTNLTGTNSVFKLEKDINLSGKTWTPADFAGTLFDGNGHTIYNLKISASSGTNIGFIASTKATIKNLYFANINISFTTANTAVSIGGVVGNLNEGGVLENVTVLSGTISCAKATQTTARKLGGIAGGIYNAKVSNCFNYATLQDGGHMGGIVGVLNSNKTFTNCFNYGKISASNTYAPFRIGGIIGEAASNTGTITFCHNAGEISGASSSDSDIAIGGIVGYCYVEINKCQNTGSVSGGNATVSSSRVGGIVGYTTGVVNNCFNMGSVTATAKQTTLNTTMDADIGATSLGGYDWTTGWLFWTDDHSFRYYYSFDNVSSEGYQKLAYAGGIAGYCDTAITGCYSTGTITGGYQYRKGSSSFSIWANNDGTIESSNAMSFSATRCRLLASPICGNIDNTSESKTYYTGTIQSNAKINGAVRTYANIDSFATTTSSGSNTTPWSDNGAEIKDGNIKNVRFKVSGNQVKIERKYYYDPPNVRGNERSPLFTWGMSGSKSKTVIFARINCYESSFGASKSATTNKDCKTLTVSDLSDAWALDSTGVKNNGYPYLKEWYW